MPLWLQRLKSQDLLEAVREFPSFPILVETYRDVLQDAFDIEGLRRVLGEIENGRISLRTVATSTPSPMAHSLQFGFVMDWMYADDTPRAERAAAMLSLDTSLLEDLLGAPLFREVLLEERRDHYVGRICDEGLREHPLDLGRSEPAGDARGSDQEVCARVAVMYGGKIMETGTAFDLFERPGHPYTKGLLSSTPRLDVVLPRLVGIDGVPPNLISPPVGCPFEQRCPIRIGRCADEMPPLERHEHGREVACWRAFDVLDSEFAGRVERQRL